MARYWEWDAPFTIHPEETALLIIDMQTGFTQPDGPLYTPQSAEQLPTIADLKKFCNEKGIPVFMSIFAQDVDFHNDHYWFRNKQRGLLTEDGDVKFKPGSRSARLIRRLRLSKATPYFRSTPTLSPHGAGNRLKKKKASARLSSAARWTNWCVDSTIREAYHKDYNGLSLWLTASAPTTTAAARQTTGTPPCFDLWRKCSVA